MNYIPPGGAPPPMLPVIITVPVPLLLEDDLELLKPLNGELSLEEITIIFVSSNH
jgi:hypothetical protein